MAFLTPTQLLNYYDVRLVCQYLSDTGTPIAEGSLSANAKLLEILGAATEIITAAALVGERYTYNELYALAISTDGGFLLRKMTADLAMAAIVGRRVRSVTDVDKIVPARAWAEQQLDLLRTGTHLFPGTELEKAVAGIPSQADLDAPNNTFRINKLTTRANRLFPWDCSRINTNPPRCC